MTQIRRVNSWHPDIKPRMAIWQHKLITGGLVVLILAHWAIIAIRMVISTLVCLVLNDLCADGAGVHAYNDHHVSCVATESNVKFATGIHLYSLGFDTIVLALNIYRLASLSPNLIRSLPRSSRRMKFATVAHLVIAQGLGFFFLA